MTGEQLCLVDIERPPSAVRKVTRRVSRVKPGGSERFRTGSPTLRNFTPWWFEGKKPLPQSRSQSGCAPESDDPRDTMTTNAGKSLFSVPSPYEIHAPMLGRPASCAPVVRNVVAGS